MCTARSLRNASRAELRDRIAHGHPIDPRALEGWAYRGTSLGLGRFVERITWKTFQKTFHRDAGTGRLRGWNVRLEQDGIDAPSRPKMRVGRPVTEWHYEVIAPQRVPTPPGFDRGLIIDYGLGLNPAFGATRAIKDPIVALSPGNYDDLLGVSYLAWGRRCIETPTYFTLERDHRLQHIADGTPGGALRQALRLLPVERAWAEALFEAILPGGEAGVPAHATDRSTFWRCLEGATPPVTGAGLRGMVHTLTFLPLADRRFLRPFFLLTPIERELFLSDLTGSDSYFVRQSLVTLKMLASFAWFDDEAVRRHFEGEQP